MRAANITVQSLLAVGLSISSTVGVAAEEQSASQSEAPATAPVAEAPVRVIELEAPGTLLLPEVYPFPIFSFTEGGVRVEDIAVTPGETILFRVDNITPDGHTHNFYIGSDEELSEPRATTDVGIADWTDGVREVEWIVPEDVADLKFGCTFPSHYAWMQGTFSTTD